jgi:O-antigen ligase
MSSPTQVLAELENLEASTRALPRADWIALYGCLVLLLFGPLAFGAVETWSAFAMEAGSAGLLMVWLMPRVRGYGRPGHWNGLFAPMLAFAALVGFQLVAGLTSYRYVTWTSALLYSCFGILCFLLTQALRRPQDIIRFGIVATVFGFALALFAVIQDLSSNGRLYWLRLPRSGGWIYGPYVNHNHYAGLMEMLFPIPLAMCLSRRLERGPKIALAATAAFMASTIVLCGSRGGVVALAVQLALVSAFVAVPRKSPKAALALGMGLAVAGLWIVLIGGTSVADRLSTFHSEAHTELSTGLRMTVTRDCWRMFKDRPVFGWGLGAFPTAYPPYQGFFSNIFVNEAHDDYAQLLVETGFVGFLIMFWFLVLMFRAAWRKLKSGKLGVNGGLALAGTLGCVGILVHSFFDFNLQVASNAAWFYVLATLVAAPSVSEPRAKVMSSSRRDVRL